MRQVGERNERLGRRVRQQLVDCMSGRSSSMVSGSGMMGRGPEKEAARDVRVRD
jgi:hypothetical protein